MQVNSCAWRAIERAQPCVREAGSEGWQSAAWHCMVLPSMHPKQLTKPNSGTGPSSNPQEFKEPKGSEEAAPHCCLPRPPPLSPPPSPHTLANVAPDRGGIVWRGASHCDNVGKVVTRRLQSRGVNIQPCIPRGGDEQPAVQTIGLQARRVHSDSFTALTVAVRICCDKQGPVVASTSRDT